MISYIFIVLIIALTFHKKELGLYVTTIFSPGLLSISVPGVGTTYFVLSVFFFVLCISELERFFKNHSPFRIVIVLMVIAWAMSAVIAKDKHYYGFFIWLMEFAVIPICCWVSLKKTEKNVELFIKVAKIICYIVVIYSFMEVTTRQNLYVDVCVAEKIFQGHFIDVLRFGLKRCQAFFSWHETLGGFCMVTGAFFQCLFLANNAQDKKNHTYLRLALLLYVTGFLTGSRSSILAIVIALFPILFKKKKYLLIVPLVLVLLVIAMPEYFQEILDSFTDTQSVSGSNSEMREGQLELSIWYLSKASNVWFGQGFSFADNNVVGVEAAMAGAESIWFRTIIDQGILGVISVAYTFLYSIYKCFRMDKRFIFFPLAYLVARTVAVIPSMSLSYIFIFIMLLMLQNKKINA